MSNDENREKIADVLFSDNEDEVAINKVGEQKEVVNFDLIHPIEQKINNPNDEINFSISKKKNNKTNENPNIKNQNFNNIINNKVNNNNNSNVFFNTHFGDNNISNKNINNNANNNNNNILLNNTNHPNNNNINHNQNNSNNPYNNMIQNKQNQPFENQNNIQIINNKNDTNHNFSNNNNIILNNTNKPAEDINKNQNNEFENFFNNDNNIFLNNKNYDDNNNLNNNNEHNKNFIDNDNIILNNKYVPNDKNIIDNENIILNNNNAHDKNIINNENEFLNNMNHPNNNKNILDFNFDNNLNNKDNVNNNNENKIIHNEINKISEENKNLDFGNIIGNIQFSEPNKEQNQNNKDEIDFNPVEDLDFKLFDKSNQEHSNPNKIQNMNKNFKNKGILLNSEIHNNGKNNIISNQNENNLIPKISNKVNDNQISNQISNQNNFMNDFDFDNNLRNNNLNEVNNILNNEQQFSNNKQIININNLKKIDKAHNNIANEYEDLNEDKKEKFIKDIFYSKLEISKLKNINSLKFNSELDEETLTLQVDSFLNEILSNNNNIIEKVKEDIIQYDDNEEYIKNFINNISPCYKFEKNEILKDIECYRNAKNDGDSFYRCFMFSYLEKLIISKNILEIKKIIFFVSMEIVKPFHYRNAEIKTNEVLIILGMIKSNIEKDDINLAIMTLNRAFCSNNNFCNSMIKYMKMKLANFIIENNKLFDIGELITYKILPKKYFNKELTIFNYKSYLDNRINMMQTDPDFFVFLITPFALLANLKLYVNEGFGKIQLIHDNSPLKNSLTIELIYSEQQYKIAYTSSYFKSHFNDLSYDILNKINYNENNCIKLFCDDLYCEQCKIQSKSIILEKIQKDFPICQNCLIDNINKVLVKRITYFTKENFEFPEYYTRDIELTEPKKYEEEILKLSLPEFKYLYGESSNIQSHLIYLMTNSCLICGNLYHLEEEFIQMNCGCKICKMCVGKFIMKDTSDKIILTNFEKMKSNIKPSICACGNPFDIDYAIYLLYNDQELEHYKTKANERLINICSKFCMKCGIPSKKDNKGNYMNIEIIKDNENKDYNCCEEKHTLCRKCYKSISQLIQDKIKKGEFDKESEDFSIDCIICNTKHIIKIPKKLKKLIEFEQEENNKKKGDSDSGSNDDNKDEIPRKKRKKDKEDNACCKIY